MQDFQTFFDRAKRVIPGGVNSPVRAFHHVGINPVFIQSASGSRVRDTNGCDYIDYVGSWGVAVLGHAHPEVVAAVQAAAERGLSFGAPTEQESDLAERVIGLMPAIEQLRLVNSGTEAAMSAIRLARGFTGRDLIVKFTGCYHGHADSLLIEMGSGGLTLGVPSSPGVPADLAKHTVSLNYNDTEALRTYFGQHGDQIACVLLEPVAGNMGCVLPDPEFLATLSALCTERGALLICDEVMTGFRVAHGGAQAHYGMTPDLTLLGKVLGGGLPLAAFGGRRDIMQKLAPVGKVYQAGTLSGNPLAVSAGLATLRQLDRPDFYPQLSARTQTLAQGLSARAERAGVPLVCPHIGGMFGLFFTDQPVHAFEGVMRADAARFRQFFVAMLARGQYFAPSPYEAGFMSIAHTEADIADTLAQAEAVFAELAS